MAREPKQSGHSGSERSLVKGYFQFITFLISVLLASACDNIVLLKVIARDLEAQ